MTRRKKTRSLKRIHQVKTGNIAKLKREGGNDRQSSKRVKKKNPSIYEKYRSAEQQADDTQTSKTRVTRQIKESKPSSSNSGSSPSLSSKKTNKPKQTENSRRQCDPKLDSSKSDMVKENEGREKSGNLLDQLDRNLDNDIF